MIARGELAGREVALPESRRRSPRVLRVGAAFGLVLRAGARREVVVPPGLVEGLERGELVAVVGPSGSGKSTLLRAICRGRPGVVRARPGRGGVRALVDRMPGTLEERLSALASAGLGDAVLALRREGELSEGERARFALARAMARATRRVERGLGAVLVVDEFTSSLDRATARALCASLARWRSKGRGGAVLCASVHEDVAGWLRAGVVVRCRPGRRAWCETPGGGDGGDVRAGDGEGLRAGGALALSRGASGDDRGCVARAGGG